jgi:hypothetical protein
MTDSFIVYLIKRVTWMPRMGQEIEYIVASPPALQELLGISNQAAKRLTHLRGIEVCLFPDNSKAYFIVKLKDGTDEDWLAEYRAEPSPTSARWREIGFRYRRPRTEPGDVMVKPLHKGFLKANEAVELQPRAEIEIVGQEKKDEA